MQASQQKKLVCQSIVHPNCLCLNVNQLRCKTQHNRWNIHFNTLIVRFFLKIAHQLQVLPKQTSLPNSSWNAGGKKCGKGQPSRSSHFPLSCWDLQKLHIQAVPHQGGISRMVEILGEPKPSSVSSNLLKMLFSNSVALNLEENSTQASLCLHAAHFRISTQDYWSEQAFLMKWSLLRKHWLNLKYSETSKLPVMDTESLTHSITGSIKMCSWGNG